MHILTVITDKDDLAEDNRAWTLNIVGLQHTGRCTWDIVMAVRNRKLYSLNTVHLTQGQAPF
jgi:hypothetical protein